MIKYFVLLLLIVGNSEQKVSVTILYESLCPDSEAFIKNQLLSCYETIKDFIDLELVPYGKASHRQDSGRWNFQCQHGERECNLNIYHACGIKYASDQATQIKYVNCMMAGALANSNNEDVTKTCTGQAAIDFNKVLNCGRSAEGQNLFVQHGDRTKPFAPKFIPTIIFNNKFDDRYQTLALTNFLSVVSEVCIKETYKQLSPYCNYCSPYSQWFYQYPSYSYPYTYG